MASKEIHDKNRDGKAAPKGYYVEDSDVEEFDKTFPPKEKLKLPGQIFD